MSENYDMSYGSADKELPTRVWRRADGKYVIGPLKTTHNMHYATVTENGDLKFFASNADVTTLSMDPVLLVPERIYPGPQDKIEKVRAACEEALMNSVERSVYDKDELAREILSVIDGETGDG